MAYRSSHHRRIGAGFLALAVLLHAGLLLVPVARTPTAPPPDASLSLTIDWRDPVRPLEPPEESPRPRPAAPTPPEPAEVSDVPAPPAERQQKKAETPARPSVAQLRRAITEWRWKEPDTPAAPAPIGRSTDSALVERMRRPLLAHQANAFDGLALPSETEIVDRWLEPGGGYRVVIRTPGGETLCGRQEPADDFRPWLQMPVMFHRCGGGGKR